MPEVMLFCEDSFHEKFVGAVVNRFQRDTGVDATVSILSARGGLPKMHYEFREFLRDLERQRALLPDAMIVVLDANCLGHTQRRQQMERVLVQYPQFQPLVSYAIPDPHIERWMLADPNAFREVFNRGCTLPAIKCAKDEYKKLLRSEIRASDIEAPLGGEEYAQDIVNAMNLAYVERHEPSFGLFLQSLKGRFNAWRSAL